MMFFTPLQRPYVFDFGRLQSAWIHILTPHLSSDGVSLAGHLWRRPVTHNRSRPFAQEAGPPNFE